MKEAGVVPDENNKEKIDAIIHKYIGEQSSYGHCSPDWKIARKEIQNDEKMRKELIKKLKTLV